MSWENTNFAEGDSGVPVPPPGHFIKLYNDIEAEKRRKAEAPPSFVRRDPVEFLAIIMSDLMAIGNDKDNDALVRTHALTGAVRAMETQLTILATGQD